jgi:hypothetical protein
VNAAVLDDMLPFAFDCDEKDGHVVSSALHTLYVQSIRLICPVLLMLVS